MGCQHMNHGVLYFFARARPCLPRSVIGGPWSDFRNPWSDIRDQSSDFRAPRVVMWEQGSDVEDVNAAACLMSPASRTRTSDLGTPISDPGYRTSDLGNRTSDHGSRTSDFGTLITEPWETSAKRVAWVGLSSMRAGLEAARAERCRVKRRTPVYFLRASAPPMISINSLVIVKSWSQFEAYGKQ